MNIKEALQYGAGILKAASNEAPVVQAGAVLCHVLKCDRTFLYAHGEFALEAEQERCYLGLLTDRVKGRPLQYITGTQEFMSLDFQVTPSVLIPRQDTEVLVEIVIKCAKEMRDKNILKILDIGAGSGCISISLARYIDNCRITAVDISEEALKVAEGNAALNNVSSKIAFVKGSIFENLNTDRQFDIVVSNPPYIPSGDIKYLQVEVRRFEPRSALDGGTDGLNFYRNIVNAAPGYLKKDGLLAFEVGVGQGEVVSSIMAPSFYDIGIFKDLSGIDRVVTGKRKQP